MAVKIGPNFSGKVKLFDRMVAFDWKGLQVFRSEAPNIQQSTSSAKELMKNALTVLATEWYTYMTVEQRNRWEAYADTLNSQAREVSNRIGSQFGNIIPARKKLMSGFNAFVGSNLLAISRGDPIFPRYEAPLGFPVPTAPLNVSVTYDPESGMAKVTWTDPDTTNLPNGTDVVTYVAVWAMIQKRKRVHPQIVVAYEAPGPEMVYFTHLRDGAAENDSVVPIADEVGGELRVQMDTVYCPKIGDKAYGALVSHPSAVSKVTITLP
jgi:hypothetical protein